MALFQKARDENLTSALEGFDAATVMAGMQLALGKPSEAALQAGDVPLSEAEPDMYPCLLALCGSGYGFFKVNIVDVILIIGRFGDRPRLYELMCFSNHQIQRWKVRTQIDL